MLSVAKIYVISSFMAMYVLVRAADTDYMKKSIKEHFAESRHHSNCVYKTATKEFIFDEFKRFGLETEYHRFTDSVSSKGTIFVNVIGVLKGKNFGKIDDKIVGIGAHYDTVADTHGVDDNGAGVAAMLDVARQLTEMNKKGTKRNNTIIFASFDIEEDGPLAGSKHFISEWLGPWLVANYGPDNTKLVAQGVIILDTMMEYNTSANSQTIPEEARQSTYFPTAFSSMSFDNFRGDFLALIYRPSLDLGLQTALTKTWFQAGRPHFEMELFGLPFKNPSNLSYQQKALFGNFLRSDHKNFWDSNLPAIFITDTANLRGDMKQCYHHLCDDIATMLTEDNINFLGKTADAVTQALHLLSAPCCADVNGATALTTRIASLQAGLVVILCALFLV